MTPDSQPELRVGRLTKAHGVRGALRVELLTDFPDRFAPGKEVEVDGRPLKVTGCQEQEGGLVITLEGITTRESAQGLVGHYCTVPLAQARQLPEDRYYHFQLVGLSVFDERRQREIGRVEEVLSYAANDVLRVGAGKSEVLIPLVKAIIRSIKPAEGRITVDLPEESQA